MSKAIEILKGIAADAEKGKMGSRGLAAAEAPSVRTAPGPKGTQQYRGTYTSGSRRAAGGMQVGTGGTAKQKQELSEQQGKHTKLITKLADRPGSSIKLPAKHFQREQAAKLLAPKFSRLREDTAETAAQYGASPRKSAMAKASEHFLLEAADQPMQDVFQRLWKQARGQLVLDKEYATE